MNRMPTQERHKINHGCGQIALIPILDQRRAAVAFG